MKRILSYTMLLVLCPLFIYAQAPDTAWTKTYGGAANDVGYSIKQTSDGGYIIAGYTESFGAGNGDVWLLKTDANGDTLWTKTYGIANQRECAKAVQQTTDDGYIIAAEGVWGPYYPNIWLIKTDPRGDTIWTKKYYGSNIFGSMAADEVHQTADGGYIVVGVDRSGSPPGGLILKTNENGDFLWIRGFGLGASSVCETFDSGYVVAGSARYIGYQVNGLLKKIDINGDSIWAKTYVIGYNSGLYCVRQTSDSGFVFCGEVQYVDITQGWRYWYELLIGKTNSQGDTIWIKRYGSLANHMVGNSLVLNIDNAFIFTGACYDTIESSPNLFLFKTDNNGDSLWCVSYGDSGYYDIGNEVLQANDGGYVIVGSTESYGAGSSDVWIIKTEPDVGVEEQPVIQPIDREKILTSTIFRGPLQLPIGKTCRVFDITGRVVKLEAMKPGVYFVEIDNIITQKIVKVK